MKLDVKAHYWSYEDGEPKSYHFPQSAVDAALSKRELSRELPRGWYCWAYPNDNEAFEEWMGRVCPTADITHRFNSGDPMYTVYINNDKEATLFQLAWNP